MSRPRRCVTCSNQATPRSEWCLQCRQSIYRWFKMTAAEQAASFGRAELRWARVNRFPKFRRAKRAA